MIDITYLEASKLALSWKQEQGLMVIIFSDSRCDSCKDFVDLVIPEVESFTSNCYRVFVDLNTDIPFPPSVVPESYWFVEDGAPPIRKNGMPPNREALLGLLNDINNNYSKV